MGEYFYPGDDVIDSPSDPIFVTKFVEHRLHRGRMSVGGTRFWMGSLIPCPKSRGSQIFIAGRLISFWSEASMHDEWERERPFAFFIAP